MTKRIRQIRERHWLIHEVEKTFGRRLTRFYDMKELSEQLLKTTGQTLAPTTLKRLWGWVGDDHTHTLPTLDLLARYAGKGCWADFCEQIERQHYQNSDLNGGSCVYSYTLNRGDSVHIEWADNRKATLIYIGDNRYICANTNNEELECGDRFYTLAIEEGQPLLANDIIKHVKVMGDKTIAPRDGLTSVCAERVNEASAEIR